MSIKLALLLIAIHVFSFSLCVPSSTSHYYAPYHLYRVSQNLRNQTPSPSFKNMFPKPKNNGTPYCRFATLFSPSDIMTNFADKLNGFKMNVSYWEGLYAQFVGTNKASGITYDGHGLDYDSGDLHAPLHDFSASSKEALHWNMLTLYLDGNPFAKQFYSTFNSTQDALDMIQLKLKSYAQFDAKYPGFGGFWPWFRVTDQGMQLLLGWENRTPALDNSQMMWSMIACEQVLREKGFVTLADEIANNWIQKWITNLVPMFYDSQLGGIRCVTEIIDVTKPVEPANYKRIDACLLDDVYEGELMVYFATFYDVWSPWHMNAEKEIEKMWANKRKKIQRVDYVVPPGVDEYSGRKITVQRGYWFSSHEQWKYLYLPFLTQSDINRRVFVNGERARVMNSYANKIPGLYASVTGVTNHGDYNPGYFSDCGIPSISFQPVTHLSLLTPYGSFPVILANETVGLVWYLNMLKGSAMQNIYGSTEATNTSSTAIAPVLTWDSKITTVVALCGGVASINQRVLQKIGALDKFKQIVDTEWGRVFGTKPLEGEDIPFMLPSASLPKNPVLQDFSLCHHYCKNGKEQC